ncbi:MAG: DUF882 domain-containing protein [Pseudomonadota bacterium]
MKRRDFLNAGAAGLIGVGVMGIAPRVWSMSAPAARKLALYNLHTQERLNVVYWEQGEYLPEQLDKINYLMRDYRTDEVAAIDYRVLEFLSGVSERLELREPIQIVSGYRSARTNDMLHRLNGDGVAKNSLHTRGMAVDIKLARISLDHLRKAALDVRRGGVGFYPEQFVHLDAGPVRHWRKKT